MPSYTPTDAALAGVSLLMIVLDLLAAFVPQFQMDQQTRAMVVQDLTIMASVGIAAFAAHRGMKHVAATAAAAKVEVAKLAVSPASTPPASNVPFVGGPFVITPVSTPGVNPETHPADPPIQHG